MPSCQVQLPDAVFFLTDRSEGPTVAAGIKLVCFCYMMLCWPYFPTSVNGMIMMGLSLVSTSHSEQSKQHWSSAWAPAATYLISECHSVISERCLPESIASTSWSAALTSVPPMALISFQFRGVVGGFTLWIKAFPPDHINTLRAQLKCSSVFSLLH